MREEVSKKYQKAWVFMMLLFSVFVSVAQPSLSAALPAVEQKVDRLEQAIGEKETKAANLNRTLKENLVFFKPFLSLGSMKENLINNLYTSALPLTLLILLLFNQLVLFLVAETKRPRVSGISARKVFFSWVWKVFFLSCLMIFVFLGEIGFSFKYGDLLRQSIFFAFVVGGIYLTFSSLVAPLLKREGLFAPDQPFLVVIDAVKVVLTVLVIGVWEQFFAQSSRYPYYYFGYLFANFMLTLFLSYLILRESKKMCSLNQLQVSSFPHLYHHNLVKFFPSIIRVVWVSTLVVSIRLSYDDFWGIFSKLVFAGIVISVNLMSFKLFKMFLNKIFQKNLETNQTLDLFLSKIKNKERWMGGFFTAFLVIASLTILLFIFCPHNSRCYEFFWIIKKAFSLFSIVFVSFLMFFLIQAGTENAIKKYAEHQENTRLHSLILFFKNLGVFVILALAFVIILSVSGVSVTPFLATLGVGSLGVAVALQPALKDFFAGVGILLSDSLRLKEPVTVNGFSGKVEEINFRQVKIVSEDGTSVIVPLSAINSITNHSRAHGVTVIEFQISFDPKVDMEQIKEKCKAIIEDMRNDVNFKRDILSPLKSVEVSQLTHEVISIQVRVKTNAGSQSKVKRGFLTRYVEGDF